MMSDTMQKLGVADAQPEEKAHFVHVYTVIRIKVAVRAKDHRAAMEAADAVVFGIALRQVVQPEMVVEMQVEQGTVHVQQNGVDLVPGQ